MPLLSLFSAEQVFAFGRIQNARLRALGLIADIERQSYETA
jgi:hypothetical protein